MDKDLQHLAPEFRTKIVQVLSMLEEYAKVHMASYTWKVAEGYRTAKYQRKLFNKRPRVTYKDGYVHESNHQSSMAVDIVPFHGHDFDWDGKQEWWYYLGHCARSVGLDWGGDWQHFKDWAHLEWPVSDVAAYNHAREWQSQNGLR